MLCCIMPQTNNVWQDVFGKRYLSSMHALLADFAVFKNIFCFSQAKIVKHVFVWWPNQQTLCLTKNFKYLANKADPFGQGFREQIIGITTASEDVLENMSCVWICNACGL